MSLGGCLMYFLHKIAFYNAKSENLIRKGTFDWYQDYLFHIMSTGGTSHYFIPVYSSKASPNKELEEIRVKRNKFVIGFWIILFTILFLGLLFVWLENKNQM